MKKTENITTKIKHELEENEKKDNFSSDVLPDNPRSLNMKNFWNNIDSFGFKKREQGQIPDTDPFLVRHYIDLYSQPDIDRDINLSKSGFPRNFSQFLGKCSERNAKKNNLEFVDKICGFNLCIERNRFNFKKNMNEIEYEINDLKNILSNLEDINYNNALKVKNYSEKIEKKNLEKKLEKGLYTPESILTNDNIYDNLINQIYILQMKQFAECICGVQRKLEKDEYIYKVVFEISDSIPSLEMEENKYKNLIKYRDPLNSISVYDLFQEKTHSYYNTDKSTYKYNKLNVDNSPDSEKKTKNIKIKIREFKHKSNLKSKKNKIKKYNSKYSLGKKKIKINKEINYHPIEALFEYQIGKKTNIDYFYCHHCKQRKPAEFSIKCKSSLTEKKYSQRPFKSFVINGTTIIRSKYLYNNYI
jgi:hypothetical protein